jgi:AsmA protein
LSLRGKTTDALKRSVEGEASLHGEDLRLAIGDLDKKFARYESSQSFNLVDVGAFFFIGPLGVGITKGYDFARIFEGSGGSTTISRLVSGWQIEHGVAHATDVAMATPKNRVALKGGLDFVIGRYDDVTVALIDTKGCARVQQKIHGPFRQPQVEKPNVLRSLAGPTAKLIRQAKELFGGSCEVFYAGSVVAP